MQTPSSLSASPLKIAGLKKIGCRDALLWYNSIPNGKILPFVREDRLDPNVFLSREPAGYINIVYKCDVEVVYET